MQKTRVAQYLSFFFFSAAAMLPVYSLSAAQVARVPLRQGVSPVAVLGRHVGRLAGSSIIQLAVVLQLQNEAALNQLIQAQNTPGSLYYHRFLAPAEFIQTFSPTPQAYNAVLSYLKGFGFQLQTTSNRQLILASGPAARVEQAFATELDTYYFDGRMQYGNKTVPSLPSSLAVLVKGVQGLDSQELQPLIAPRSGGRGTRTTSPSGFSPPQIAKAYDYPYIYSGGSNGAGKTMAVATAYDFKSSDVSNFDSYFKIGAAAYQRIFAVGSSTFNRNQSVETTVDVEESTALAPGATEYVYEISSPTYANFTTEYNRIVTDDKADAVTSSWGACEQNTGASVMSADDGIFAEGAAQGQSWFFAAGDSGAFDCGGSSTPAVDYPASTPYATAASGTSLTLSNTGSISSETAWSGSGGGVSADEAQPAWEYGSSYFNGKRWLGDFSMDANPNTGMAVYYSGKWAVYGGTSFVAPFGAALAASIAQYKKGRLGIFASRLNQLANSSAYSSVLHDITSGSNGYYSAGSGWDPPTGWGSPDGYMLLLNF